MSSVEPNDSAVVVALSGGLGNQLFQYAMGRALSLRNDVPLVLDLAWFQEVKKQEGKITTLREYALAPFGLPTSTQCKERTLSELSGISGRIYRRIRRYLPHESQRSPVFFEKGFPFDQSAFSLAAPIRLEGYWQSPRYFEDKADVIRKEIRTPGLMSTGTSRMMDDISNRDAICLHIRRGDYVTNSHAAAAHGLCSIDYYYRGMEIVLEGLANPHCFIFSDDTEWARSNLELSVPATIVDVNGPDTAHQDLWLMANCKRFITANSSFSWWGAWLSENEKKMVVAPKVWFADRRHDTRDLIPAEWIRI